jgi:ASCH domain
MRGISVKQPYAWLIVSGKKNIENRSWYTHHRGPLAIHAGLKRPTEDELEEIARTYKVRIPEKALKRGGIIGVVDLEEVVTSHKSKWFVGPYGWVLRNARQTQFLPMTGRLGFMEVPDIKLRVLVKPKPRS